MKCKTVGIIILLSFAAFSLNLFKKNA